MIVEKPMPLHLLGDMVEESVPSKANNPFSSCSGAEQQPTPELKQTKPEQNMFAELKALRQPDLSGIEFAKTKKKKKKMITEEPQQ